MIASPCFRCRSLCHHVTDHRSSGQAFITVRLSLIRSRTCDMTPNTGSSIRGPITSASAINGSSGNAVSAIASTIGELRASVVRFRLAVSSYENRRYRPTICPTTNTIIKNNITGGMSFNSGKGFCTRYSP